MTEEEAFQQALGSLDKEIPDAVPDVAAAAPSPSPQPVAPKGKSILQRGVDLWKSAGAGIAKAGFETKDFLFGEPTEDQKSPLRRGIEQRGKELASESVANSLTMGISQMVTGLVGAGKLMAPLKAAKWMAEGGKAAKVGFEIAKGAVAGATVLDPHEERLSNLVQQFPTLQNPVTDYLAATPGDSAAEGRFKNALESIGVDFALVGVVKAIKMWRAGDVAGAKKEISKLDKAKAEAPTEGKPAEAPVEAAAPDGTSLPAQVETPPGGAPGADLAVLEKQGIDEHVGIKPALDEKGQPVLPNVVREPDVIRTKEITDDELGALMKESKADFDAIREHGSMAAAIESGYKFKGGTPLPWQKLRGTDDVMAFIGQSAKVLKGRYDLAKGGARMGDARVKALADELGDAYNEDPAMILGEIKQAGENATHMVAAMEAGLRIGNKMFLETHELAARIRNGNLDAWQGNVKAAEEELKARLAATIDTMSYANSILSNSGRAVRRARSEFAIKPADLARLKSMDGDQLAIIMEKAEGDPRKVMLLANRTWQQRVMDQTTFHLTNGLLWMWPTHLVNMTTNAYMLMARPAEKMFGASAMKLFEKDPAKKAELGSMVRQGRQEYGYLVASIGDGWQSAVEAFRRGDSILSPHNTEYFNKETTGLSPDELPWKEAKTVWDVVENAWLSASYKNVVGLPARVLGTADEFFKTMRYRAVVQSRAATEAADVGLSPAETKAYVAKALSQAIDPASGRALDQTALLEAKMTTFQQELNYDTTFGGSLGRGLTNLRRTAPIVSWVLPFIKTPMNVVRYGIKMTPGLNMVQKEFRDALLGKAGDEAKAHAIGQMAMGSLFSMYAYHLVSQGRFTGSGPSDYKMQQELMASGWRPYSFVWHDGQGNTKYFQVGRFDPVGLAMGLIADIYKMGQDDPERDLTDVIQATSIAVAKNLGEKTFLLNLNSGIQAMLDPENLGPRWVGRTVGSMLPGSSLMRGMNPDPYLREARGFMDNVMRGVPGLSETLPIKYSAFGEPIERTVGLIGTEKPDVVEGEHNRILIQTGKGIGKPAPQWEGVDLRDVTLKSGQNAYERFQQLGGQLPGANSLKTQLEKIIKTKAYQDMPDGDSEVKGTRLNWLGKFVTQYRTAARKVLIRENPELMQYFKARQKAAAGAIIENRKNSREGDPGARSILEALSPQ